MFEICILFALCSKVKVISHERKHKATWFIIMTIVLWLIFEFLFLLIINFLLLPKFELLKNVFPYFPFFGFLGGALGGWVAYIIVKKFPTGTYEAPVKTVDFNNIEKNRKIK